MDTCDATERAEARALRQSQGGQARHARTACLYRASARLLAANVEGTGFKNTSAASHAQPPKSPVRYNPAMAFDSRRDKKYEGRMAIWKMQPSHHSKRRFREQKQKQRRCSSWKAFQTFNFPRVLKELKVQKAILHDSRMRLNLQVNRKNSCQQSNSASNAAVLFSPHRCRVTIFAGVLPAALPSHPHRGLRFGALPQSMFGATVTAHLSGLCVAQWEVPANCAVSSSTSMAMFGRSPAARGTSRFWGEATKTKGPRLKQEPLRTGRIGSSRALPASCGRRRGSFLSTSPGTSSQSRKTALRPSRAERLDRLSRFQLDRFEHSWHHDLGRFVHAKIIYEQMSI